MQYITLLLGQKLYHLGTSQKPKKTMYINIVDMIVVSFLNKIMTSPRFQTQNLPKLGCFSNGLDPLNLPPGSLGPRRASAPRAPATRGGARGPPRRAVVLSVEPQQPAFCLEEQVPLRDHHRDTPYRTRWEKPKKQQKLMCLVCVLCF